MLETWRWFGPDDPVTCSDIRQAGADGIVTALHSAVPGEVWQFDDIAARKEFIEAEMKLFAEQAEEVDVKINEKDF